MLVSAIAVNNVEDTRTVLDYYKHRGGEDQILDTFKAYQAQLREEEEEINRNIVNHVGVGRSPFSRLTRRRTNAPAVSAVSGLAWVCNN